MKLLNSFPLASASKSVQTTRQPLCLQHFGLMILLALTSGVATAGRAQTPDPAQTTAPSSTQPAAAMPAPQETPAAAPSTASPSAAPPSTAPQPGEITEDELKRQLVGKPLFLRDGYLGDSISFTEHGDPTGHPAKGSYTLSAVEIEKVRLTKHKVELIGARYGLHFLGAMPYEDPANAVDRVKITPKKKVLKITIDREQVVKPKKEKASAKDKKKPTSPETAATTEQDQPEKAAEPLAEQAADPASVTTTVSPAHAAAMLRGALDKIFAPGLDDKLRTQMPEFWQLYYQAQAAGVDYHPRDPNVLRSSAVDQQARLTSSITPDSNEFAQASGIAGRALYRAVIGPDGKVGEIAVVRPIGFGLDENAVAAIRKASFQPGRKSGQPVAETLDLTVLFRIYSKRTSVAASDSAESGKSGDPLKPGPYTVRAQAAAAAETPEPTANKQP